MKDLFLKTRLDKIARRYRSVAFWRSLAACWAGSALVCAGIVVLARAKGWSIPGGVPLLGILALGAAAFVATMQHLRPTNYRWLAQRLEKAFPSLNGVLLTAVEDESSSKSAADFLRYRVVRDAIAHSQEQDWRKAVPTRRLVLVQVVHAAALACLVVALIGVSRLESDRAAVPKTRLVVTEEGVNVSPGDASVERGESLVVLAKFGRSVPGSVNLVVHENGTTVRTVPLVKNLGDPLFGGSVTNVERGFSYRLEYDGNRTREYQVQVFEHPKLVRSDVDLTYPEYTRLAPKHIDDTRRFSAVEGTRVDLSLQLNKPVKSARLVSRDGPKSALALDTVPGQPAARRSAWVPEKSGTYDLELIDVDGRANKVATPFVIEVQPNRPPEVRLATPRGDLRPSALEEVSFSGTVWDDFGTLSYGLAYSIAGSKTKEVALGRDVPSKEKRDFAHLLEMESLGAKTDDLVSWHVWAEDIGPDGKPRRTNGDLYFAEIRPFDEVFRESQDMASDQEGAQQQQGRGNAGRRLTELQKQIINATWKLQRDGASANYASDLDVVRHSQESALEQATEAAQQVRSPREQGLWQSALKEMQSAVERLKGAEKASTQLAQALPPEQAAYQALLKLQAHETSVTRGQRNRSGSSGSQAGNQRQINQLDLQQSENRYETQRQARAPQNEQQREQVGIMNRLQDLARRQQDLNERLQELQTALQEARTEQQREELRRRLKRLEEEQRQMLADTDELRQRMNSAQNQSQLSQQREELDQARDALQQAAEAAEQGTVAQALASGTRAQRQLQQVRDEIRQQSSSQFAEELREMRGEARDLSRRQEQLEREISSLGGAREAPRKSLGSAEGHPELANQIQQQRERWNRLLDRAREISEQAETSEPLVSRELYDSVRKASQDDAASVSQLQQDLLGSGQLTFDLRERLERAAQSSESGRALELAGEMLRAGNTQAAEQSARRAGTEVEELRRGVERAAESVLGDDTEQLRLARSELEALSDELQREMTPGGAKGPEQKQGGGAERVAQGETAGESSMNNPSAEPTGGGPRLSRDAEQQGQADMQTRKAGESPRRMAGAQSGQPGSRDEQTRDGQQPAEAGQQPEAGQRMAGNELAQSPGNREPQRGGQRAGDAAREGARGERITIDSLLNDRGAQNGSGGGGGAQRFDGPLTGERFGPWTERLRDVEQLLDTPELRESVAAARERARALRREYTQSRTKPDWAVVQLQVVKPLVEVRNRLAEELARRANRDSLAPIDHDPVPNRFAESVRKYYEELGKDGSSPQPR